MTKKIFIGGTGRSGTTVVSRLLGAHNTIYKIPFESRFLIDYNGLLSLFNALTKDYSIDQSRIAIRNFDRLMRKHLTSPLLAPYARIDNTKLLPKKKYLKLLEDFLQSITEGVFIGSDFQAVEKHAFTNYQKAIFRISNKISAKLIRKSFFYTWPKEEMFIGKYYSDSKELLGLMAGFTNDLFSAAAKQANKQNWCEDTPANILNKNFLQLLFPNAYFVHCLRHPVGVAWSMRNQIWTPKEMDLIVKYLSNLYEKLIFIKENHSAYLHEIKIEDLAVDYNEQLQKLCEFLDIENIFLNEPKIEINKVDYWKNQIPNEQRKMLDNKLKKYIEYFNYE